VQSTFARLKTESGSSNSLVEDLTTIVIPARNEEPSIGACLDSVLVQDEQRLQVIVVDGCSSDRTPEIVARYAETDARICLLYNDQASIPRSLNLALGAARGEWFLRVDAHSTIPPHYVRRAKQHLRTTRWGGVGGRKNAVGITAAGRAIAAVMASRFGVGNSVYHHGTSMRPVDHVPFGAYSTRLVRDLGGWDERVTVNEDFEFDFRIRSSGRQLLFDPRLVINWRCRQSLHELWDQYRRYGKGKSTVALLHPESMRPRHFIPPAFVVFWTVGLALGRRRPMVLAAALASYAALLGAASASTAKKVPDIKAKTRIPAAFIAMHIAWGVGFWEGLAANLKTRLAEDPEPDEEFQHWSSNQPMRFGPPSIDRSGP
jgi:succinoglycan biosynthesis protein ExoA